MLLSSAVLTLLPLAALASPLSSRSALYADRKMKHSWSGSVPSSVWKYHSTPDPTTLLSLRLGLRPSNFDTLLVHLSETSDPFHERYGKHLSRDQVDELMRPGDETVQEVKEWLNWHGIEDDAVSTATSDRSVTITIPVSLAETMLNTTYHVYAHEETNETIIRTLEYSLPRHLHDHINLVSPTTYFGTTRSMETSFVVSEGATSGLTSDVTPPASCNTVITPTCLQDIYNTAGYILTQTATNKIGITGYGEQFASLADLTTFTKQFLPNTTNATFTVQEVNGGGNNQNDPGIQANLDTQIATGIAWPTPIIFYSTGGSAPSIPDSVSSSSSGGGPFLDWIEFISTVPDEELPTTFSTGYGEDEQTVPADYATEVCNLLATLGLRGASVMFTSGGPGVGAGTCKTNNGTNEILFQPIFPASCPFVTAVGATTGIAPQVAAMQSGGGFSNLFQQPSYQSSAVNLFLDNLGGTNAGLFNPAGRAYPDVSAQSQVLQVILGGRLEGVTGVTCATPTFSGVIALLNDFKLAKDGTTLGFLNPLLYANPSALNDVVTGTNPGCGTHGFSAGTGWDPVTGLGTPDFVKLQAVV
ncbi:subtilisin-like protein [Rhodocollybia butyracea]|uniref:tripeptidyl-peptidase II n=1 Tax=Rhodocollybia butyracea TaxID=206335 RepID=A0A9P5UG42_9AGAR|nr:subtilisin-like protein [Rhodocollybia butyracea]